jgi:glycosyltransferase involved in cell wall biosynthesis
MNILSTQDTRVIYFTQAQLGPYHLACLGKFIDAYPESLVVAIPRNSPSRPWNSYPGKLTSHLHLIGNGDSSLTKKQKVAEILSVLRRYEPEATVFTGYNDPPLWVAARWAKRHKVARILTADSWRGDHARFWIKEIVKKHIFVRPMFDAAFVPGTRALDYLSSLGLPLEAIWRGLYVVDNEHFSQGASKARQDPAKHRSAFGLPDNYFLTACRLSPEKNLGLLIRAFASYRARGGSWRLVIVGTGPQTEELTKLATGLAGDAVSFAGWQQYEELPVFYGLARCFILPSISEPWGLVVNEAMASGLPLLVSRKCGCQPELCHRNINGFDFDPLDMEGLTALMLRISGGTIDLKAMGAASHNLISQYSLDNWISTLKDCIETTVARLRPGIAVGAPGLKEG